ncbi:hypothetical protein [Pedobacter chitinilyticus]|uniref:Uncharacterized protein n=1 Tax=Pedobacter chitinilyticus TaxID=2233776 RepID=A0A3S3R8Y9_9SPHI|nr:hypothetical protein [Pedobacter chitinilyticus]RWU10648.1 hypothetical protein DPV69_04730 [Pedobacter chitinilyticus]
MEFKYIEEVLPGVALDLNVLNRETVTYNTLLYQHEGVLSASNLAIKNGTDVSTKLRSYFALLKETGADLGLVPEYCCPFVSLNEIIADKQHWPNAGKLWTIGMESLNKEELVEFRSNLSEDIISYFDERVLQGINNFVDPLVYLFRTVVEDVEKLVLLMQFKNFHMGVWSGGDVERDNLIPGREIYILRNRPNSVHLMSVICSEAMNLSEQMTKEVKDRILWGDLPFLVLNPQVNPGPTHPCFLNFRSFVLSAQRTEVIGLNWNNKSKLGRDGLLAKKSARSGVYMRSNDFGFHKLARIRDNHQLGLYYYYYGMDKHAFILNSAAHAFLFNNTSVNINSGVAPQQMRNGPHMLATYVFDHEDSLVAVDTVSDEHIAYLQSVGCHNVFLNSPENCVIEKELLACLSTGEITEKTAKQWSELKHVWSMKSLDNTDINRRITVGEDLEEESVRIRNRYVELMEVLGAEILRNPGYLPNSLSNLKTEELLLGYSHHKNDKKEKLVGLQYFRCNLVNTAGEMVWATVCYLGMATDEVIGRTFQALQSLFDLENKNRERVVVFYRRDGAYHAKSGESSSSIRDIVSGNENSFLK